MDYTKVTFHINNGADYINDLIAAQLGEIGFDCFEDTPQGFVGYCPTAQYHVDAMKQAIDELPMSIDYQFEAESVPDQDWNSVWEENSFTTINIDNRCIICSPKNIDTNCEYHIIINPKQAFGTGYHQTTQLIIRHLLNTILQGKTILDMGCGTGVLGILTALKGARKVVAIDIDEWSQRNAIENAQLNHVDDKIEVRLGSAEQIRDDKFDLILANINRNILIQQIPSYARSLNDGGQLIVSGFYSEDVPLLQHAAEQLQLRLTEQKSDENWTMIILKKE